MRLDRKIVSLNLALAFIVTMFLGFPSAFAADETAYSIIVGDTLFYNTEDKSGTGWSYSASDGVLTLDGYSGSSILASGDLTIYSYETVKVTGDSGTRFGSDAITVDGCLYLFAFSGSAAFTGGRGDTYYGGDGIDAASLYISSFSSTQITSTGGYGVTRGGYGITGGTISLYAKKATITGGNSSNTAGSGIYFSSSLYIDVSTMTVQAGNTSGYAIVSLGELSYYLSKHVTLTTTGNYKNTYTPNTYTLTLYGDGGTFEGSSSQSFTGQYPTYTDLGIYVFTRSGYQQVGWVTGSDFVPLGDFYLPTSNTSLYASWVEMQSNSVLFIGNGGTINENYYLKTTTGTSVSIPDRSETVRTDASGSNLYLLGWTNSIDYSCETDLGNYIINRHDKWYLPGATSSIDSQTTLYAHWISEDYDSNIICYSGNGGTSSTGGEAVVQGSLTSGSDISLYVQDDMGFTRTGYSFDGWKDSGGTSYATGQLITRPTADFQITNLYAQWVKTFSYTAKSADLADSATCVVTPARYKVDVSLAITSLTNSTPYAKTLPVYYALYQNGRMVAIETNNVSQTSSGMTDSLSIQFESTAQPDTCKIFVFNGTAFVPVCAPLVCQFK